MEADNQGMEEHRKVNSERGHRKQTNEKTKSNVPEEYSLNPGGGGGEGIVLYNIFKMFLFECVHKNSNFAFVIQNTEVCQLCIIKADRRSNRTKYCSNSLQRLLLNVLLFLGLIQAVLGDSLSQQYGQGLPSSFIIV